MPTMKNRPKTIAITVGSLAAAAVLATGVTGVAMAADGSPGPQASIAGMAVDTGGADRGGPDRSGMGRGPGGQALHGETTVKQDDGTIATIATVNGTVTAVSATSITVTAEDGYAATYAISDDTVVRVGVPTRPARGTTPAAPAASTDTIADVSVGDVAHVQGTVAGALMTASAVHAMTAEQAAQLEAERAQHEAAHAHAG
ncbi:MAG: hypothetical protein Q7V58_07115 [Actinomycetota bacterium]|nr:hypothetical protein [Actinomycetota bacterium]